MSGSSSCAVAHDQHAVRDPKLCATSSRGRAWQPGKDYWRHVEKMARNFPTSLPTSMSCHSLGSNSRSTPAV